MLTVSSLPYVALVPYARAEEIGLMDPIEASGLLEMDARHNPLLADLWRDDVNDDLVGDA